MAVSIRINIKADFLCQADVTKPATATGIWGDATGETTLEWRIALTKNGAALGSLSATASERSSDAGRYYTTFDKADLTSALAAYVGRVVYIILAKSGDLDGLWWPALVVDEQAGS